MVAPFSCSPDCCEMNDTPDPDLDCVCGDCFLCGAEK